MSALSAGRGSPPRSSFAGRAGPFLGGLWRSWWGDAVLVLILLGLPFLFFWRFVTPDLADRATFARGDFLGQYYPLRRFVAEEFGDGRFPLWNPYIYGGQPALADIQSGAFYPPNAIVAWLLGGERFTVSALEVQVILHFSLAAVFTFLFVRRLTGSRLAGVVSATAYAYSGYMTSFPVRQLTMLGVGVWLPLILYFLDVGLTGLARGAAGGGARPAWLVPLLLAGLASGVSVLGGHPQTSLYVAYLCVLYVLHRVWPLLRGLRGRHLVDRLFRLLLPFGLVPLVTAGLSAVQLLPTLEFIRFSTRTELDYAAVSWGLPVYELIALVYPGYLGNSPQYVGILPLVLAGVGLLLGRRWKLHMFWALTAVVSLLLSLGGNTFLYSFAYNLLPGFAHVRDQERVLFLFTFSVAVLAGYGARAVAHDLDRVPWLRQGFDRLRRGLVRFSAAFLALTALHLYGWTAAQRAGGGRRVCGPVAAPCVHRASAGRRARVVVLSAHGGSETAGVGGWRRGADRLQPFHHQR